MKSSGQDVIFFNMFNYFDLNPFLVDLIDPMKIQDWSVSFSGRLKKTFIWMYKSQSRAIDPLEKMVDI